MLKMMALYLGPSVSHAKIFLAKSVAVHEMEYTYMSKLVALLVNFTIGVYVQEKLVEGKHITCQLDHFFIVVLWHTE